MPEKMLSEQIKKINESNLSKINKDRLISELLKQITPKSGRLEFNPASGYILSFLFPPLGLFIGGRYLLRYGENEVKPGIICIVLTCVSLVVQLLLFKNVLRALLSGLSLLKIPGI